MKQQTGQITGTNRAPGTQDLTDSRLATNGAPRPNLKYSSLKKMKDLPGEEKAPTWMLDLINT